MTWIDIALVALLLFAAVRGFMRGFIIEVCSMIGIVLGIWGAIHLNDHVAGWLGLDPSREAVSFLITLVVILVLVHLIGKALTTVVDIAQLSVPNKIAGLFIAVLRKAFVLSVVLNLLLSPQRNDVLPTIPVPPEAILVEPLKAFAPLIIPALRSSKWMDRTLDELKEELNQVH